MTATSPLADGTARARIGGTDLALDENLFVEAGAGTGKTTSLVDRLVAAAQATGSDGLHRIAAVTFTEAAAAELRDRVRTGLAGSDGRTGKDLALHADEMFIGTIHAFARRLLTDYAVEAGVPPGFDVVESATEIVERRAAWDRYLRHLLESEEARAVVMRARALGLAVKNLGELAGALHPHWERLREPEIAHLLGTRRTPSDRFPLIDPSPLLAELRSISAVQGECAKDDDKLLVHIKTVVAPALASMPVAAETSAADAWGADAWGADTRGADPEATALATLRWLVDLPTLSHKGGQKGAWPRTSVEEIRDRCTHAAGLRDGLLADARERVLHDLTARVAEFVGGQADERRQTGRLGYSDLLVLAHDLLADHPRALDDLRQEYRFLFIDEFQDTDPVQTKLAFLLAGTGPTNRGPLDAAPQDPDALFGEPLRPGGLFVVGDPKQSIYRFRRADISLYASVRDRFPNRLDLTCNFRSVPGVVAWVNAVFGVLFDGGGHGQAMSQDLAATRPADPPGPVTPVRTIGTPMKAIAAEIRETAARDIARTLRLAVGADGGAPWAVAVDRRNGAEGGDWRSARWGDVALLLPTRTGLAAIERALDDADVPYRLEGASLLWGTQEVRDLLAILRAADEPANVTAVLAALRSPLFGCGDDDLLAYRRRAGTRSGGLWDPSVLPHREGSAEAPDMDEPVARSLLALRHYCELRWTEEPSALLQRVVAERGAMELALAQRRPRDRWQRIRWLVDQARQFDEQSGGALSDFLSWAGVQQEQDGRTGSLGPPDPDDDAVRIMTVHGAKGLEFPIAVLAGLDGGLGKQPPAVLFGGDRHLEVRSGTKDAGRFETAGFEDLWRDEQQFAEAERVRLLYVAATRARDHLVLAMHRAEKAGKKEHSPDKDLDPGGEHVRANHADRLADAMAACPELWSELEPELWSELEPELGEPVEPGGSVELGELEPDLAQPEESVHRQSEASARRQGGFPTWEDQRRRFTAERETLLGHTRRRPVITAMALLAEAARSGSVERGSGSGRVGGSAGVIRPTGVGADPGDTDDVSSPTWDVDSGLRRGRAVHDTLAALDLVTGRSLDDETDAPTLAAHYARVHGLAEQVERDAVVSMVQASLDGPLPALVTGHRVYTEMPVAVPLRGVLATGAGAGAGAGAEELATDPTPDNPVLEGTVDLVVETEAGYVIVDHKTAAETDPAGAIVRYRAQLAAYALALELIDPRRPVVGAYLHLVDASGATLEPLPDLRDAIAEIPGLAAGVLSS